MSHSLHKVEYVKFDEKENDELKFNVIRKKMNRLRFVMYWVDCCMLVFLSFLCIDLFVFGYNFNSYLIDLLFLIAMSSQYFPYKFDFIISLRAYYLIKKEMLKS